MKALYSLKKQLAGFDFYRWLGTVKALGATEIVFDIEKPALRKWDLETTMRRFHTICEPGPALVDLPYSFGQTGIPMAAATVIEFVQRMRDGLRPAILNCPLPVGTDRYTVTIRADARLPHRNSNEPAWRAFAAEIGARVIEDYSVEPRHIYELLAIYRGAEMNFGVPNGPMGLASHAACPVAIFGCGRPAMFEMLAKCAITPTSPMPAVGPEEHMDWGEDDLPTLRAWFARWRAAKESGHRLG